MPATVRSQYDLSVVVPCFNEEANVQPAYDEIVDALGPDQLEIIFVDDGSTDETLTHIKKLAAQDDRVGYVSFSRNFGIEAAICAGYRYARRPWLLHLDADMQFPAAEGLTLMAAADGKDAVFGVRQNRSDPLIRKVGSWLFDVLARRVLRVELPPHATMFRLVRTGVARRVVDMQLGTPYFLATLPRVTSAWTTVPTEHRPRQRGEAKVSVRSLTRHAIELFISHARRTMALTAGVFLLAGLLAAAAMIIAVIAAEQHHVATALVAASACLLALALAVATRYLVHIGRSLARPPLFLIRETNLDVRSDDLVEAS